MHRAADEEPATGTCPLDVELKWMTEVSSSVYATPLITDLYSDGRKDIIVPSFVHYLEVRPKNWDSLLPVRPGTDPGDPQALISEEDYTSYLPVHLHMPFELDGGSSMHMLWTVSYHTACILCLTTQPALCVHYIQSAH